MCGVWGGERSEGGGRGRKCLSLTKKKKKREFTEYRAAAEGGPVGVREGRRKRGAQQPAARSDGTKRRHSKNSYV